MAHTFGSTVLARSSAATSPITRSATTSASDTVLVVVLKVDGATNRAGGALTFNGVDGVQANSTQKAAASPEASVEIWYWAGNIRSGAGSLFIGTANLVIPNTGSLTIYSSAHTGRAASGFTSQFDVAAGTNGTSANPATGAMVSTVNGAIYFAAVASGAQTFAPSARTGTSLHETDDGAHGGGAQYLLQTSAGSQDMSWTQSSDDWGAVGVVFKEVPAPSPSAGGLTLAGTVSALALTLGMSVGAMALSGHAPTVSVQAGVTSSPAAGTLTLTGYAPTVSNTLLISIPSGSLVFKGPAQGSQAVSIPIGAGSLGLAGQAPSLRYDLVAAPVAGSLSLTGYAPAVLDGKLIQIPAGSLVFKGPARAGATSIAPDAGALSFAGHAPSALIDRPIAIPVGTLTLDGQYVGIAFQGPDAGVLTLTGYAPTLQVAGGSGTTIAIAAGSLTLAGQTPNLASTVPVGTGVLTLVGQAPSLSSVLPVGAGSLALAGQAPSLASVLPIGTGTLTLVGYVPSTSAATTSSPAAGSLSLSGHAPSLALRLPIATGALTLTGYVPALLGQGAISPDPAVLTLVGYAPTLAQSYVLAIGSGALALSGQAPTISIGVAIPIGGGSLVLSGQAPSLGSGLRITPDAGALVLAGLAPTVLATESHIISPGVGSLTFTGLAPTRTVGSGIQAEPDALVRVRARIDTVRVRPRIRRTRA
jgi:hypothetical protein